MAQRGSTIGICRWAGLLHVLWCEETGREPGIITLDDWKRALDLLEFDLHHYRLAQGVIEEGPAEALANRLQSWIKSRRGQLHRFRDIKRHLAAFAKATDDIRLAAVEILEDRELVQFIPHTNPGGKPSPAIEVL